MGDEYKNVCNHELRPREAPAYKHLISINAGKPKGGLKAALKLEFDNVIRISLSEQKFEKVVATHGTDVVRYQLVNLSRTISNYQDQINLTQALYSDSLRRTF